MLASFARSQEWSGICISLTHRQRMATVASISPWHMSSQVSVTMKSWRRPSLRIPASQALSKTIEELNQWRPEVSVSYASIAAILAEEQLAHRLHFQPKAGVCCIRNPYIANQQVAGSRRCTGTLHRYTTCS